MSCLLTAFPVAAPYTLGNIYGETFTYIEQTADEAVNAYDESEENDNA